MRSKKREEMIHPNSLLVVLLHLFLYAVRSQQDLNPIRLLHKTEKFADSSAEDCFVSCADDDELLLVRRGGPAFDLDVLTSVENPILIFLQAEPGVPKDEDMTAGHITAGQISFTCEDPIGYYAVRSSSDPTKNVQRIALLFNPYAPECSEYLGDNMGINGEEYIDATEGLIWQGLSDNHEAHVWNFDQFNGKNLHVALHLLRRVTLEHRSSPVAVSRALSFSIDADYCEGKWGEGKYESGHEGSYKCATKNQLKKDPFHPSKCTDPSKWTGTTELTNTFWARHLAKETLPPNDQEEFNTNVQFCQCFVYAGVLTTFGRALGIATRPVTTFQSAHDVNADKSISKFYWLNKKADDAWDPLESDDFDCDDMKKCQEDSKECGEMECQRAISLGEGIDKACDQKHHCGDCIPCVSGTDSVWSFHVWNDMWMSRPDIKQEHADGWQAVDATPQELSDGVNQMGPASVHLISGNKNERCFDNQFVNSEVHAYTKLFLLEGDNKNDAVDGHHREYLGQKDGRTYYDGFKYKEDAFDDKWNTIGVLVATKKIGPISSKCKEDPTKCQHEKHDVTWKTKKKKNHDSTGYKEKKSVGPGEPLYATELDTSICMYGSKSDGIPMDTNLFRFKADQRIRMLRAQSMGDKKRKRDTRETEASDPSYSKGEEASKRQRPNSGNVVFSFNDENRRDVIMGLDHILTFKVTNRGAMDVVVNSGYSGIVMDYRGIPLVGKTLRTRKIPVRIVMKGKQTLWHMKTLVPAGAVDQEVRFVVPSSSLSQITCGKKNLIRWTLSTNVVEKKTSDVGGLPPIHEFNAKLVSDGILSGCEQDVEFGGEMDVDDE